MLSCNDQWFFSDFRCPFLPHERLQKFLSPLDAMAKISTFKAVDSLFESQVFLLFGFCWSFFCNFLVADFIQTKVRFRPGHAHSAEEKEAEGGARDSLKLLSNGWASSMMSSLNYQTIGHRQLRPSSYFCQLHVGAGCQEWWGQGNAGKHLDLIVFGLHLRQMARPLRQRVRASNWRSRSWSSSSLRRPRYFLLNLSKIFHWCLSIYIAWHSNESGCHATAWFRVRREDHSCWHSTSKGPRFRLEDCLALRPFKGILSANYGWQPKSHWDLLRSVRRKRVARRKTEPQFLWAQRHFVLGGVCVPSSDLHLILHPETWVETKFLIQVSLEHAPVAPNLNSLLAGWEWLPQHGASFSNVFVASDTCPRIWRTKSDIGLDTRLKSTSAACNPASSWTHSLLSGFRVLCSVQPCFVHALQFFVSSDLPGLPTNWTDPNAKVDKTVLEQLLPQSKALFCY